MAFLDEGSMCSVSEYHARRSSRTNDQDVKPGELYMLMMLLHNETAAKLPLRMLEVRQESGAYAVKFTFLNNALEPTLKAESTLSDGFVQPPEGVEIENRVSKERGEIVEAYLRDYFDDQFGLALSRSEGLVLST